MVSVANQASTRQASPFVDGEWLDGAESIEVADLAEDSIFGRVGSADPETVDETLRSAREAQSRMEAATLPQRADWLETIANGLEEYQDECADVIVREAGKPITAAESEVSSAVQRFRRAAEETRATTGEFRPGSTRGHEGWQAIVIPEPLGTVLSVTPYNYPLSTPALHVAPAIAAGNTVVLKPASATPLSSALLTEIVEAAGLPAGAFNYLPGRGREIGDHLAADDRIDAIALTGSSEAGKRVAEQSGMVQLHMELGGNAPAIVFEDAEINTVVASCVSGAFKYAGQRCSAVSRVLVEEAAHDDLANRLTEEISTLQAGDLFDPETDIGPVIDVDHAEWVMSLVDDAIDRGADCLVGGERDGRFVDPTLLASVPSDARIVSEEQFGPVLPLVPVEDESEALAIANADEQALDGAVFTSTYDRALRVAEAIDAGAVRINGAPSHGIGDIPFGGNDASGIGREGIGVTVEAFSTTKSIIL